MQTCVARTEMKKLLRPKSGWVFTPTLVEDEDARDGDSMGDHL